ncbi:MAG: hypothetical protein ACE1ZY_07740, partial [Alphaproteobacteria bacterium]
MSLSNAAAYFGTDQARWPQVEVLLDEMRALAGTDPWTEELAIQEQYAQSLTSAVHRFGADKAGWPQV